MRFLRGRMGTKRGGTDKPWTWSLLSERSKATGFGDSMGVSSTTLRNWDIGQTKSPMTGKVNAALAPFGKRLGIVGDGQ